MIKRTSTYIFIIALLGLAGTTGCKKDFGEINTNPGVVETPDVKFLLSYTQDKIVSYQGTEWVWESMEQLMRFTQHASTSPYELSGNVNTRYRNFYLEIMPNMFEIRRQAEKEENAAKMQKMRVVSYVLQVLQGIKVTDMNGSIPYTEAEQGRYAQKYDPVYDSQETLFNTWLAQLDSAILVLSNGQLPAQESFGTADLYYQGDWTKWIKLANTLKLRIAVRVENQDAAKARDIFRQVMQDPTGPVDNTAEIVYSNINFTPFGTGGDIDYRSRRYGTISMVNFMKAARDPRLAIYFDRNDLVGSYRDTLAKYGATLPAFIDPNDPLIMYQGGPADWNTNPAVAAYISNAFRVGTQNYFLISPLNRKFFSPKLNGATTGQFTDVPVSFAETCFYVAEFIQKGYGAGIDTKGSANDWYRKGIAASIRTMNKVAETAGSATAFTGDGEAQINAYLEQPQVRLNGVNDLERIYIQQYLALFRQPNEAFVFCRRTGYPRLNSAYYAREVFNELIPRRFWQEDPGEVNRANWQRAQEEQGFTPRAQDVSTLSKQRVWYDKAAPEFGRGR